MCLHFRMVPQHSADSRLVGDSGEKKQNVLPHLHFEYNSRRWGSIWSLGRFQRGTIQAGDINYKKQDETLFSETKWIPTQLYSDREWAIPRQIQSSDSPSYGGDSEGKRAPREVREHHREATYRLLVLPAGNHDCHTCINDQRDVVRAFQSAFFIVDCEMKTKMKRYPPSVKKWLLKRRNCRQDRIKYY